MKKCFICSLVFLLLIFCLPGYMLAQTERSIEKGTWVLGFGVGPGTHYFGNGLGLGPAVKVNFETGMWELGPGVLTLGGEAAFSMFWHHWGTDWDETWINMMFGARSAYHYGWNVKRLDTYGGIPLGLGFTLHSFDEQTGYKGFTPFYPYLGIFLGASYFFTDVIGINGEFGYNVSYANIGMVFKVK